MSDQPSGYPAPQDAQFGANPQDSVRSDPNHGEVTGEPGNNVDGTYSHDQSYVVFYKVGEPDVRYRTTMDKFLARKYDDAVKVTV